MLWDATSYCSNYFSQSRVQWIRLGARARECGRKEDNGVLRRARIRSWVTGPPTLAYYRHDVEQIPSLYIPGSVEQHLSLYKSVGKSLHSVPQGPLTWQTWVRGPVDSGWQVEAAIRKAWDDSAWSLRCLQWIWPSMLRSY